jgi:hypothetical protein
MSKSKSAPRKTSARTGATEAAAAAPDQLTELVYQALETEMGGVEVYRTALHCVVNDDLREEWTKYLSETEEHVRKLRECCLALGLDPDVDTPGRQVVRHIGKSLVQAMYLALGSGEADAAQLVAAECVVHAETKDHMNWSLIGAFLKHGEPNDALAEAHAEIEDQEDEHLYHSQGWARELWIESLGLPASLPPPEEKQDVKSAAQAAQAKESREMDAE